MGKNFASMKKSVAGPMSAVRKLNFRHLTAVSAFSKSLTISSWMFCLLVAAVIAFGVRVPESLAATYYVSPTGNDRYTGTSLKPFRTIQKAADLTKAGDTVIVKNGVYTSTSSRVLNIKRQGTPNSYITFKSENPEGAVLDGRNNATNYGIVLTDNAAYIRIQGFEIRNFGSCGIYGWGNSQTGVGSHDVIITENRIHHIGRTIVSDCNDSYGRSGFGGHPLIHHYTFEGNTVHDVGRLPNTCSDHNYRHDHGLYLQGKYITVRNNTFYNHKAGWAIKVDGYWGTEVGASENSHVIADNIFRPDVRSDSDGGGNVRFYNNRTYNEKYGYMKSPKNVLIENNSFYKPDGIGYKSAIIISNNINSNFNGTILKNNKTSSKYLYCEYLGLVVTKNVTDLNNKVNAYDSLFTSIERVTPNS